jgi:AcrR family transcriptional regulator
MPTRRSKNIKAPNLRGVGTRSKLVKAAEKLFAKNGIENVSLREIARAAHQRNAGALQYHFGDKEALIQAVIDKHLPAVILMRHRMLDELQRQASFNLHDLVRAFVLPNSSKLDDPDGGRAYILIRAQLAAEETLSYFHLRNTARHPMMTADIRLAQLLNERLGHIPEPIFAQRMAFSISLMFHGLADLIRMAELTHTANPILRQDMAVESLVCSVEAILASPISKTLMDYCASEIGS